MHLLKHKFVPTNSAHTRRLGFESLEKRQMLSVTMAAIRHFPRSALYRNLALIVDSDIGQDGRESTFRSPPNIGVGSNSKPPTRQLRSGDETVGTSALAQNSTMPHVPDS
jgi:hypothetical protein